MHAELDDVAAAVHEVMTRLRPEDAQRQLGIVVDPGHAPGLDELAEAIRRFALSAITLSEPGLPRQWPAQDQAQDT